MKNQLKIVSTLIFLLLVNISFANGTENKPKKSQRQEQQQTLEGSQKGEIEEQQLEDNVDSFENEEVEPIETDSVEDDSVSKYNFIFYFLYKFKYEAEA